MQNVHAQVAFLQQHCRQMPYLIRRGKHAGQFSMWHVQGFANKHVQPQGATVGKQRVKSGQLVGKLPIIGQQLARSESRGQSMTRSSRWHLAIPLSCESRHTSHCRHPIAAIRDVDVGFRRLSDPSVKVDHPVAAI